VLSPLLHDCASLVAVSILEQRKYVAVLYACIWAAVATNLVLLFMGPHEGLLP
jgi:hypothetical protein